MPIHAASRADELVAKSDLDGQAIRKFILKAIDELLANVARGVDQDRHQGRSPRSLCHVPACRNRNPNNPVRQHPAPDGRAAPGALGPPSFDDTIARTQTRSRSLGFAQPRSSGRVNLVCTIEGERMGAPDRNRIAVPIKHDPL